MVEHDSAAKYGCRALNLAGATAREFTELVLGSKTHAEDHVQFEKAVNAMKYAGMKHVEVENGLCRIYFRKLNDSMSQALLSRGRPLDGSDKPNRQPRTWYECNRAVGIELRSRADAQGASTRREHVRYANGVEPPPAAVATRPCKNCPRLGHPANICPTMVARARGDEGAAFRQAQPAFIEFIGWLSSPYHVAG